MRSTVSVTRPRARHRHRARMALARRATRDASTQFRAFVSRALVAPRVSNASVVAPRPMGTSPGARARRCPRGVDESRRDRARVRDDGGGDQGDVSTR